MGAVSSSLYKGHRYPGEIISHCVWLHHWFPLSFREVEESSQTDCAAGSGRSCGRCLGRCRHRR